MVWSEKITEKSYKVVTFSVIFFTMFFTEWHAEWIRVVRGAPAPNKARKDPNLMFPLLICFYQRGGWNFDTEGETLWFLPASSNMIGGRGAPTTLFWEIWASSIVRLFWVLKTSFCLKTVFIFVQVSESTYGYTSCKCYSTKYHESADFLTLRINNLQKLKS